MMTAGAATGGDRGGDRRRWGGNDGGVGRPGVSSGSAAAAKAASQSVGLTGPSNVDSTAESGALRPSSGQAASGLDGVRSAVAPESTAISSRTGAEAKVGATGAGRSVAPCGGNTGVAVLLMSVEKSCAVLA